MHTEFQNQTDGKDPDLLINGVQVHAEGAGPDTIVMVHGWPDTWRLWDAQVAALKDEYRCVRFTLPGFDIAGPRRAWSLDETMRLFAAIVTRHSPERPVTLLLHDWGCLFGYHFQKCYPQLVARIVAVDIGDAGSGAHRKQMGLTGGLMVFAYQAWLALAWRIGGRLGDGMSRSFARIAGSPTDPARIHSGMNYPYYITWTKKYGSYKAVAPLAVHLAVDYPVPVLYIYATRKPVMFHSRRWIEGLRRNPANEVLAFDTGHWPMAEQPEAFNLAVRNWLARTR
jgi:pimeloyl-ACP methyl ester carboxylesterase